MPGAEPPTPTPAPDPFVEKTEDQRSPEPGTVQVQGYDTEDVPHVLHESPKATVEPDLEAGVVPPVGLFEVEEPQQPQPQIQPQQEAENQNQTGTVTEGGAAADALRTPRAELKTEESLAPLDLGVLPAHHAEGSDATAVNVDVAVSPRTSSPNVWTPGTYVLLNARSGTALDLSGADHRTVIGWPMHGGPNQQWEFIPTGHGYIVRCIRRSKEGHSLYLSTEGGVKDGARIIASTYPVAWNIEPTDDGVRISWPNSEYVFDLADRGNAAPGTKIQLATSQSKEACQQWHYTRCAPAADEKELSVEAHSARAVSPPATTDTITISEERDFVVTTRTTTTTVITTVTEVTRTPKSLLRQGAAQSQPQRRSIAYR
ncbi:ricin B lectin domain-containing protein [Fomes fomentarius]|nr:ricin B lectin domain-containing protein [Fomes fomentarius]